MQPFFWRDFAASTKGNHARKNTRTKSNESDPHKNIEHCIKRVFYAYMGILKATLKIDPFSNCCGLLDRK